jgi:hypothetical protein
MNLIHSLQIYFSEMYFIIMFLSTPRFSEGLFLSGFLTKTVYAILHEKNTIVFQTSLNEQHIYKDSNKLKSVEM